SAFFARRKIKFGCLRCCHCECQLTNLRPLLDPGVSRKAMLATAPQPWAGRPLMKTRRHSYTALFSTITLVGAAVALPAGNPAGVGPQAAAESIKQFKVADGLEVSLVTSEPLVRNPTDMDVDERGRIWVAEGVNYRSSFQKWGVLQPEGDRILTLEY